MGKPYGVKVTGEPRDTETIMRGSERGRWKSARKGNSLAAYSTACSVLRGRGGGNVTLLPDPYTRALLPKTFKPLFIRCVCGTNCSLIH
jgi:hypothetical protein